MSWKNSICTLNLSSAFEPAPEKGPIHRRLTEAFARLEKLERQRAELQDPLLGKREEKRIIRRELRELELHEVDEQLDRISAGWRRPLLRFHCQKT